MINIEVTNMVLLGWPLSMIIIIHKITDIGGGSDIIWNWNDIRDTTYTK